jgi:predicted nucleic-acid-binding Zn-ribbon protein
MMQCPHCKHELFKESECYKPGNKRPSYLERNGHRSIYNLHCLNCDHYFVENWNELHYYSFEATSRVGRKIRRLRELAQARYTSPVIKAPAYCLLNHHKPIRIPADFHAMWLQMREEQRKAL